MMQGFSYLGLFAVMFLAGCCAPIPWELVLIPAGATDLNPIVASLMGGLGSSLGAVMGYWLGKRLGRPLILMYGKYVFVDRLGLEMAERWLVKWGSLGTMVFRSIQYLPYKAFSVAAGILRMNFLDYVVLTTTGSLIRCLSLVCVGRLAAINLSALTVAIMASPVIGCLPLIVYVSHHRRRMGHKSDVPAGRKEKRKGIAASHSST